MVFKCNNFKIQTLERTHTYTHIHSVPKINIIKVSAKLCTRGNKVLWKLPDFFKPLYRDFCNIVTNGKNSDLAKIL